ncbi:GNAT family N-acetyltransferase [Salinicoccus albus]|uniref:GNAT family N-acetyltransferase n=1 Tax=Salinicoccus albus TaxID=418756 RepID=UPI00035F81ED|nr:GNAT family N-acetyltransferase [Salinicoccus albus]
MFLRKAGADDLARVMEIKDAVVPIMINAGNTQWSDAYPDYERFSEDVSNGSLYVYTADDAIKGFVVADDEHPEPYRALSWRLTRKKSAAMHRMAVDPACQGQGIAANIIEAVEQKLAAKGYKGIRTDTSLENKRMQMRFEQHDYQFIGKLKLEADSDDWYVAYEKVIAEKI